MRRTVVTFQRPGPCGQGHSKKALGGEEDGIETVLGEGLTNGRERSRRRPRQAQDRVAQRCQRLRGAAGAHAAGVLAQAHVPAPVQLVASRPEEFHLRPLTERCGSLSAHTAPTKQPTAALPPRSPPVASWTLKTTAWPNPFAPAA